MSAPRSVASGAFWRRRLAGLPLLGPGVVFLFVLAVLPVALVTVYAFFERGRFGGVDFNFTLDNFVRLADPLYLGVVLKSIGIAGAATGIALLIGYPAALFIARLPHRWRTLALIAVLLPFWTNFLIRTYAWILLLNNAGWINQGLSWLGITSEPIHMLYTEPAVVVGLVYMYLPLMILPLYASLASHDPQLTEAAVNLGSSPFRVFRTITLPLSVPGALTGCIFVFVPSMGNFIIPELIGGGKTVLIGNLIRDQFLKARDWPFGAALALVMTLFLVLLLVLQQRASRAVSEGKPDKPQRKVKA
ncbi:ABC transporter permease [Arthrobacter sp.]|uniref:ABC transporter permease n=1 Tax=Arthrobacter sp. TaxID=1667 RepID=UPI00289ED2F6|nr:ABC transporter permease [Arthrobacter sp.]